jgi:ABC-type dipeptide/oligopeptide/nickel transport system permease component
MRVTRSAMLDVMDSEYIKMARIKGNTEKVVIWKHALRNALIPVVSVGGIELAYLLGGTAIIETVFAWPGMGSMMIQAIYTRDYPLVQAGVLIISVIFIAINLGIDLLYGVIDPRIRYE